MEGTRITVTGSAHLRLATHEALGSRLTHFKLTHYPRATLIEPVRKPAQGGPQAR